MHYIIYKTTNLFNGKFYIGKHQTNDLDDDYVGSGKLLKRAIKKYGLNNFKTEIIETCPTAAHMNLAEKVYVVIDSEISYNLCPGGRGGFGYINATISKEQRKRNGSGGGKKTQSNPKNNIKFRVNSKKSWETKKAIYSLEHLANLHSKMCGESLKPEAIQKRKETYAKNKHAQGENNSQFGTCWLTNSLKNIKIKRNELDEWLKQGYRKGRIINNQI